MNSLRVSLIHMETRETLEAALSAARKSIQKAAEFNPNFIALPEYFSVPGFFENYPSAKEIFEKTYKPTLQFLQQVSSFFSSIYIVGGTIVEGCHNAYFNTCTLWRNGHLLGSYRKRSLINAEKRIGFSVGEKPFVFSTEFCNIGILICADIFNSEAVEQTVSMGAEVLFLPVAALYAHPDVKGHPLSERIASEKGLFIIKIGNVRSGARGGRSAVIAPWGVIQEVPDVSSDFILTTDLDIQKLRNYREKLSRTLSTSR
ncbi:MAG: carbon-nitrogen hydrolase family protein [Candidatus Bathyarchaeia archaeon]